MNKILLVQTNYPGFLNVFDKKNNHLSNYKSIKKAWNEEMFGHSNFYSMHLKKYGWTAEEIIVNDQFMQTKWMTEQNFILKKKSNINLPLPESIKNFLGLRSWIKKVLFKQIETIKPDVVYIHDLSILSKRDVKRIKHMGILVVGQIACPLPINKKPLYEYDLIISSFPHYVKMFRQWGINSEYLAWCFEDSILNIIKPNKNKKYDVVFVGGFSPYHTKGNRVFEKLSENVKVDYWGYGEGTLPINSRIKKTFHGLVWGGDMYRIFANAKIVINRHIGVSEEYANNMRMFEATGMGSLLITDYKSNINVFFKPGKEIVVYKNVKELLNKVRYFLKNEDERIKIAKAGQERTLEYHTYEKRMEQLANILNKYIS